MSLIRGEERSNRHKIAFTLRDLIIAGAPFDQLAGPYVLPTIEYLGRFFSFPPFLHFQWNFHSVKSCSGYPHIFKNIWILIYTFIKFMFKCFFSLKVWKGPHIDHALKKKVTFCNWGHQAPSSKCSLNSNPLVIMRFIESSHRRRGGKPRHFLHL